MQIAYCTSRQSMIQLIFSTSLTRLIGNYDEGRLRWSMLADNQLLGLLYACAKSRIQLFEVADGGFPVLFYWMCFEWSILILHSLHAGWKLHNQTVEIRTNPHQTLRSLSSIPRNPCWLDLLIFRRRVPWQSRIQEPIDDWTGITNPSLRRRLQNRLNQRAHGWLPAPAVSMSCHDKTEVCLRLLYLYVGLYLGEPRVNPGLREADAMQCWDDIILATWSDHERLLLSFFQYSIILHQIYCKNFCALINEFFQRSDCISSHWSIWLHYLVWYLREDMLKQRPFLGCHNALSLIEGGAWFGLLRPQWRLGGSRDSICCRFLFLELWITCKSDFPSPVLERRWAILNTVLVAWKTPMSSATWATTKLFGPTRATVW
jgi:hypothetical protein